jgi:hypothetical protein
MAHMAAPALTGRAVLYLARYRRENWTNINGHDGFPSPIADPSWWDLSPAALASQYYAIFSGGGQGGGDFNDDASGVHGGTMIWSASAWLSRSGSQIITDYQVMLTVIVTFIFGSFLTNCSGDGKKSAITSPPIISFEIFSGAFV